MDKRYYQSSKQRNAARFFGDILPRLRKDLGLEDTGTERCAPKPTEEKEERKSVHGS